MKTKKLGKKVNLNKRTVSNLQNSQMENVRGGHIPTWTQGDSYCAGDTSCLTCAWLCNTDITCHGGCPA